MKKIYSFLAMVLMAGTTFAQTLSVTIGGKPVSDAEVVEIPLESAFHPIFPGAPVGNYNIDPEIVINSTVAQSVTVTVADPDHEDGTLQNCFAGGCQPVKGPNWIETKTAEVPAGATKSGIDIVNGSTNPGNVIRTFEATISTASEKIAFTVKYYLGTYASVTGVKVDGSNQSAYTITGTQVNENTLREGTLYIKGGKKYMKK